MGGVDKNRRFIEDVHGRAHFGKYLQRARYVAYVRQIFYKTRTFGEQGSGKYCNGGVFCAADIDRTAQAVSSVNNVFIQGR